MPYAPQYNKPNDPNAPNGSAQGGQNISGQSASFNVPGAGSGIGSSAQPSQKSSGQYQNLEKYVSANQPQGTEMGQKVAGSVGQKAETAIKDVGALNAQVQKVNPYDVSGAISNVSNLTPEQKAEYKTQKQTGGYTGPTSSTELSTYAPAFQSGEAAKTAVSQTGSDIGQKQLLTQEYKRPNYTAGAQNLDQVILQNSIGGNQAISGVNDKYKTLSDQLTSGFSGAENALQGSRKTALENLSKFAPAEDKTMKDFVGELTQRAKDTGARNLGLQQRLQSDLAQEPENITKGNANYNYVNPETWKALGLTPATDNGNPLAWSNTRGVDINKYMNYDQTPMTANTVATNEERNKYQALNDLFGAQGNEITQENPMANYSPFTFDKTGFQAEVGAREKAYNDLRAKAGGDPMAVLEANRQINAMFPGYDLGRVWQTPTGSYTDIVNPKAGGK